MFVCLFCSGLFFGFCFCNLLAISRETKKKKKRRKDEEETKSRSIDNGIFVVCFKKSSFPDGASVVGGDCGDIFVFWESCKERESSCLVMGLVLLVLCFLRFVCVSVLLLLLSSR